MNVGNELEQLRQQGYRTYVRHHRVFEVNGSPIGIAIKDDSETPVEIDNVLTRKEFEEAAENFNIYTQTSSEPFYHLGRTEFQFCVSPRGGFTEVELIKDGKSFKGKYNFNNKPFCRQKGVKAALGRALASI